MPTSWDFHYAISPDACTPGEPGHRLTSPPSARLTPPALARSTPPSWLDSVALRRYNAGR